MSSATTILERLRQLEDDRRKLIVLLLRAGELAVGTLARSKRPCGNPRCKQCAEGPSHEQVVFYYTDKDGRRTSTFVRRSEEARFEEASKDYADFRRALRDLKHLETEERRLMGALKAARALDPISRRS